MEFVETPIFTEALVPMLEDEEYRELQMALALRPEQGRLIPGTHGLRKIRWAAKGHGKRGGCRLIYYWHDSSETCYMLYIYAKNEQEDLTARQERVLGRLVREEFG